VKRLSRLRRHKAAGPILLIFALFTIGTTFQVASAVDQGTTTAASRSALIEEGKRLFLKGCSSCHGLNAAAAIAAFEGNLEVDIRTRINAGLERAKAAIDSGAALALVQKWAALSQKLSDS